MIETGQAWAEGKTATLARRWQSRLMARWHQQTKGEAGYSSQGGAPIWFEAEGLANINLRGTVDSLAVIRIPLDASDTDICEAAERLALNCQQLGLATLTGAVRTLDAAGRPVTGQAWAPVPLLGTPLLQRGAMERLALAHGIEAPQDKHPSGHPNDLGGMPAAPWQNARYAIARMQDAQWWRRKLRAVHAKHVEGAAIGLGYVNRSKDAYVSNESVQRRLQQNQRNAAALAATTATNGQTDEAGDLKAWTLAELAATGPANKAIRRAELMTRIAGFERIALDLGHGGVMVTMTCPSRMHKWTATANGVFENPRYDGTLPNEAQQHLAKTWARIRAKLKRLGVAVYGFRIAEPNHDGTPHWHILLFAAPAHMDALRATILHYALQDSGTERGALTHRVDWKPIQPGLGTAAGYIAKYVAKNIDGHALTTDLCGDLEIVADGATTAQRVEAWASTWRIRQFQQIGGPPVGPWRELRRVEEVPANAPQHLKDAHAACNKANTVVRIVNPDHDLEAADALAVDWSKYVRAQGGHACGRAYAIRVEKAQPVGKNKYGEQAATVPVGVSTLERFQPEHMTPARMGGLGLWSTRRLVVESVRHVWTITRNAAAAIGRVFEGLKAQLSAPWTCVNNCTGESENDVESEPGHHAKRGARSGQGAGQGTGPHQGDGWGLHPAPV